MSNNIKWKIIKIDVSEENQIIPIDYKLPNDITKCKGIYLSIKELLKTKSYITKVGELSLSFNSRQIYPLHFVSDYDTHQNHKKEFLPLDCDIETNKSISGFYLDYATIKDFTGKFSPYTLLIYLECY